MSDIFKKKDPQVEHLVKLYKRVSGTSVLQDARILNLTNNGLFIHTTWTQKNLDRKLTQQYLVSHFFRNDSHLFVTGLPVDTTTERLVAYTNDGERKAVLRNIINKDIRQQFLEIWDRQSVIKHYDLVAMDLHGEVYTDDEFVSFDWSPDGNKLVYIAEKKLPKSEPFYSPQSSKGNKKDDEEVTVGNEHIYKPDWGENLVGKHQPVICVLDMLADNITVISSIPEYISPGQVIWAGNDHMIGVGWRHDDPFAQRFGLIFCTNRPSYIFSLKNGVYKQLSDDGCAVRNPRLSPYGNYLVWLERSCNSIHHNVHRLMLRNLTSLESEVDTLVDIIPESIDINNKKKFYGIYGGLPRHCWSEDSRYVFFSTTRRSNFRSYIVDIRTKKITEIENGDSSLSILDVKHNIIAFREASLKESTAFSVGRFKSEMVETGTIPRIHITRPIDIDEFKNVIYETTEYTYDNEDDVRHFNFIYFGPANGTAKSVPLIVIPHGGPHSAFNNTFSMDLAFLVLAGFATVLINYRGSVGMGSRNVEFLLGKIGNTDVTDCVTATTEALRKYKWLDPERIALSGGSHGGFLVTHLSGQFPHMYKTVVTRNPVIDVAVMFATSDIPDWCAAGIGEEYRQLELINISLYIKMVKCSPIMHVSRVKAPTLICIGLKDMRVPSDQGRLWYNRLRSNGVKAKLLVYEDNHQLATNEAEMDCAINQCLWLLKHTSKQKDEATEYSE